MRDSAFADDAVVVELVQYTDPGRTHLAEIAAIYLGKEDTDNLERPLRLIRKKEDSFLKSQIARFRYRTSLVTYGHLVTYTQAKGIIPLDLRAAKGFRASQATDLYAPSDAKNQNLVREKIQESLAAYQALLDAGEKPQVARYALPQGAMIEYTMGWSFLLLGKHFFPDRLWIPGAAPETKLVAEKMWHLVSKQDPELWDTIWNTYGPYRRREEKVMDSLENSRITTHGLAHQMLSEPEKEAYSWLIESRGKLKSMWED